MFHDSHPSTELQIVKTRFADVNSTNVSTVPQRPLALLRTLRARLTRKQTTR